MTKRRPEVTSIVCAYNEERTIATVVEALLVSPLIDEIIVVDDGSTDATADRVVPYVSNTRMRLIRLPQNRGKGCAMSEGILHARGEALAFVDGDLLNLDPDHVATFVDPLLSGQADMVIGYPSRGKGSTGGIDPVRMLSGERALWHEDILPLLRLIRDSRFGVETLINLYYRRQGKRLLFVPLRGLIHPIKLEKTAPWKATWLYALEATEIAQAMARHYDLTLGALGLAPQRLTHRWTRMRSRLSLGRLKGTLLPEAWEGENGR